MSAFLQHAAPLAAAAVTPYASHLVNRMFPAPHVGFMVVATTVATYIHANVSSLAHKHAKALTDKHITQKARTFNPIFYNLSSFFSEAIAFLFPLAIRAVGQRLGYPVPEYIQTFGYFALTSHTYWLSKQLLDLGKAAWQFYFSPKLPPFDRKLHS